MILRRTMRTSARDFGADSDDDEDTDKEEEEKGQEQQDEEEVEYDDARRPAAG